MAHRPFGGAGFPRTCYAADRTGHALLHAMYEQLLKRQVYVYEEWYVTSLIVEDGGCRGVIAWDLLKGGLHAIEAKAVILATGGCSRRPPSSHWTSPAWPRPNHRPRCSRAPTT